MQGSSAAYHGYWIRDFTTVDPHLGTEADFAAFVDCAHRLGLKVYLDVVVNHTADVILPHRRLRAGSARRRPVPRLPRPALQPGALRRAAKRFPCLRAGDDAARAARSSPATARRRGPPGSTTCAATTTAATSTSTRAASSASSRATSSGSTTSSRSSRRCANGLADVYASWIRRYKVDGFRIDTARHVDRAFFRLWVPRILRAARAAGVRDFQLFGEAFIADAVELSGFVRDRGLPNVLDFPLQDALAALRRAATAGARGIAARLARRRLLRAAVGRRAHAADLPRQPRHGPRRAADPHRARGRRREELLRRVLLGHDLLYLLRGAPVVYYGDEVGMIGRGGDKAARQDMFPTEVADWQHRAARRLAADRHAARRSTCGHPVGERLRALGGAARAHPALATGVVGGPARAGTACSPSAASTRRRGASTWRSSTPASRARSVHDPDRDAGRDLDARCSAGRGAARASADGRLDAHRAAAHVGAAPRGRRAPCRARAAPAALTVARDDLSELWRVSATVSGPRQRLVRRQAGARRLEAPRRRRLAALPRLPRPGEVPAQRARPSRRRRARPRRLDVAVSPVVPLRVRR